MVEKFGFVYLQIYLPISLFFFLPNTQKIKCVELPWDQTYFIGISRDHVLEIYLLSTELISE